MKKISLLILFLIVFLIIFLYVHQKVLIYVEVYNLSKAYKIYNELVDRKDFLMYNLKREVSLPKLNQWAKENNLSFVGKDKILVLNLNKNFISNNRVKFSSNNTNIKFTKSSFEALAEEKE